MSLQDEKARHTAQFLHSQYPSWTSRKIAGIVKRPHTWVCRWWERDNTKNKSRGSSRQKKLSEGDLKFIKKNVKGTQKASGGERGRRRSFSEVCVLLHDERKVELGENHGMASSA